MNELKSTKLLKKGKDEEIAKRGGQVGGSKTGGNDQEIGLQDKPRQLCVGCRLGKNKRAPRASFAGRTPKAHTPASCLRLPVKMQLCQGDAT